MNPTQNSSQQEIANHLNTARLEQFQRLLPNSRVTWDAYANFIGVPDHAAMAVAREQIFLAKRAAVQMGNKLGMDGDGGVEI